MVHVDDTDASMESSHGKTVTTIAPLIRNSYDFEVAVTEMTNRRQVDGILDLYQRSRSNGVIPNVAGYRTIVATAISQGLDVVAMEALHDMSCSGMRPSPEVRTPQKQPVESLVHIPIHRKPLLFIENRLSLCLPIDAGTQNPF